MSRPEPFSDGPVLGYPPEEVARYRGAGLWGSRTIGEELRHVAARCGDRTAVVATDRSLTYRELDARTDQLAAGLNELGLEPGDRVLFQLGNSSSAVLAWYGCLKSGLIPVCTLTQHRGHEIAEIARQSEAAAHIVEAGSDRFDLVEFARRIAEGQPTLRHLITVGGEPTAGTIALEKLGEGIDQRSARTLVDQVQTRIDPDDIAVFQLSGGTTSVPKIIPRLHAEYWYNARAYAEFWNWDESVRAVHLAPLIHNAGIVCALHGPHAVGGCSIVGLPDADVAVDLMSVEGATDMIVNLALADLALDHPRLKEALRGLRRLVFSGTQLPSHLVDLFESDRTKIVQLFGMGEGLFMMTPEEASAAMRHHTVGVPMSELDEVRVCRPGTDEEVPDGEPGELCCRGPYTIRGYYGAATRNVEAFSADGFYRTGDVSRAHTIDGRRCFSIEGRFKDLINRGGEKVNAEEVELLLLEHEEIAAAAVVAMPDPRLGERACAFLVAQSKGAVLSLEDLTVFLDRREVAKFKWPERLEWVDELPRTKVGKIDKKAMREIIAAKLAAE